MLRVVQEHSGAPYAALLGFLEGRGWIIQCQSEGESRTLLELPTTVIHGARRTLEPVLLGEAEQAGPLLR